MTETTTLTDRITERLDEWQSMTDRMAQAGTWIYPPDVPPIVIDFRTFIADYEAMERRAEQVHNVAERLHREFARLMRQRGVRVGGTHYGPCQEADSAGWTDLPGLEWPEGGGDYECTWSVPYAVLEGAMTIEQWVDAASAHLDAQRVAAQVARQAAEHARAEKRRAEILAEIVKDPALAAEVVARVERATQEG